MRLLHTADWHLNDRLGGQDRTEHLRRRVESVARHRAKSIGVDVLVIAGDMFSEQATEAQVASSFRHLRSTFRPFFDRGGTILAVTGNHDQDGRVRPFIELARAGMDLDEPPCRLATTSPSARCICWTPVSSGACVIVVVWICSSPFCRSPAKPRADEHGRVTTAEELNRPIGQRPTDGSRGFGDDPRFDTGAAEPCCSHT